LRSVTKFRNQPRLKVRIDDYDLLQSLEITTTARNTDPVNRHVTVKK